ncbi:MAG: RDD family protein, partial [Rhodospirillales bacterium]|nr:RDD family protein [Rhodospirillales bacterium]
EAVSIVDGGCPTLTQAAIRTVTFYGSVSLTSGLVLLVMPLNPGRRTLHDFLSGTVVLRRLPEGG